MNLKINNFFLIVVLSIVSISVNYYYGSLGVLPIDTFAFFDTGFRLTKGDLPFVDYWTISGPFIDLLQAIYFSILGVSWKSYILNGSIINLLVTLVSFYFFKNIGLNLKNSFFYSICVSFLANPSMGTPFPDHYSTFFSLFAIISFLHAIESKKNLYWFLIPIFLCIAFLCKQTPASYVIIFFILNFLIYMFIKKDLKFIKPIIYGSLISLLCIFFFILVNEIDILLIITQYFLYPRTIGLSRIGEWSLTFNKAISTLKLIHILLIPLIIFFLRNLFFKKNYFNKKEFFLNLNIISFSLLLIFHQWLTLNFIFIFFLIPYLCALIQINFMDIKYKDLLSFILIVFCLASTTKYHFRFNEERKMLNLENTSLGTFYNSANISSKLKGLKWVTKDYSLEQNKEIKKILKIKTILQKEKKQIMFLSSYQFFSAILDKPLNSPNRWYGGEVAHPTKNNPYYKEYLKFNYNLLLKKKIEIIYIDVDVGDYHLKLFNEILEFFPPKCAKINKIEEIIITYNITDCQN